MSPASPFKAHHRRPHGPDHCGSLSAAPTPVAVQPVSDLLERGILILQAKGADDLNCEDGEDSSHLLGRHMGRRPSHRLQRSEG